jgi:DNA-binding response OmpR family regulator
MNAKVLVVDDEDATRRSLADILRLEGYQVETAADGEAAVLSVEKNLYDLILLDLKMPGMDGLQAMRAIHKLAPDTQIILLTAHGSLESAIEALRHGAHDYLLKPSSPQQIVRSVANGLSKRAETTNRRLILAQLETTVQQLKNGETPIAAAPEAAHSVAIPLGNGIMLDLDRREIWRGDLKVSLTPTEGKLVKVLLDNRSRVFTHRELVWLVQGYETSEWEAPEVLRPLVSRLRRKLVVFPDGEKLIVSVRGTGYVFEKRGRSGGADKGGADIP